MIKNYRILNRIHYILLIISIIALFINNVTENKFLKLGIPLWITIITYISSLIIGFISWLKYNHLTYDNPIKTMKNYQDYFDKTGYALFTGGLVTLATADKYVTSFGLIIIGITCIIISAINRNRIEKFEESKMGI